MHRWFRIWTAIALLALTTDGFSEESQANANDSPTPSAGRSKHKQAGGLLQNLEDLVQQQSKQIETQGKQVEQLGKQIEDLTTQIALQTKQAEQQHTQIDALSEQFSRLAVELKAETAERSTATPPHPAPSEPVQPSTPVAVPTAATPEPVVETSPQPSAAGASPGESEATTHTVKKGENLITIAHHYGTTVAELLKLNKIGDERKLQIGQVLSLPKPGSGSPSPTPSPQPTKKFQ